MLTGGAFGYPLDYALWWLLFGSIIIHTWCFFRFFPKERWPRCRLIGGNLLVFACLLGAAGIVGETYYRFLCVETDPFGWSLPSRRWFALHARLNSMGCRDEEWVADRTPDTYRIAFVGDSFTYGWGIEDTEDRFPNRLEAALNQKRMDGPPVEVMNVAKPGWGTGDQVRPVRDMIRGYDVDEVVLCWVANDIEELLPTSEEFNPLIPPQPRWFNPDSSCLLDHLFRRIVAPRAETVTGYHDWLARGYADADTRREYQRQLHEIVQACRDAGVRLRVVLLPYIQAGGALFDAARIYDRVGAFFEANGVETVDLSAAIAGIDPAALMVNRYDAHPNERAHALFAEALTPVFEDRE